MDFIGHFLLTFWAHVFPVDLCNLPIVVTPRDLTTLPPPPLCLPAEVTTAAVCVYPARVADAVLALKAASACLPVASGKIWIRIQFQHRNELGL